MVVIAAAIIAVVIAVAATAFAILTARRVAGEAQADMSPASIDDVQATRMNEGLAIPVVFGTCRLAGNILWYGNLINETTFLFGETTSVSGYRYFVDMWQAICLGKVELLEVYVNGQKVQDLGTQEPIWTFLLMEFSDGETNTTPSQFFGEGPGEYVNNIPGVAHIYWNSYLLGENATVVPTIHFVVKRILNTPINHQNMDSGSNPAAVVYSLMRMAGVPLAKINIDNFNLAADFFFSKDYGLNFAITAVSDLQSIIQKLSGVLDFNVTPASDGRYVIKFRDVDAPSEATITTDDYLDFKARRPTYSQVPNLFKANFLDKDQEYTQRTITEENQAVHYLTKGNNFEPIDLKVFRDVEIASKRLTEIAKNYSYPGLEIEASTHLGFSKLVKGSKVTIQNTKIGIVSADFWITEVGRKDLDKNEFEFRGRQVTESLFDDVFTILGGSENVTTYLTLVALDYIRIFELPYLSQYGFEPVFLIMANRMKGFETSFLVQISQEEESGYQDFAAFSGWSQAGFLAEEYPVTKQIDLNQGILYTPELRDPRFSSVSYPELFTLPRFAVIGNELLGFREVTNEGSNVRLSGIVRGLYGTPIETHVNASQIFLVNLGNNVLQGVEFASFYVKIIPQYQGNALDPSSVDPILVSTSNKAKKPRKPGLVEATRTGSTIDVLIYPSTPDLQGAGQGIPENTTDVPPPFPFYGELLLSYDSTEDILTTTTEHSFSRAGAFDLTIKHRRFGLLSDSLVLSIGASDGVYRI